MNFIRQTKFLITVGALCFGCTAREPPPSPPVAAAVVDAAPAVKPSVSLNTKPEMKPIAQTEAKPEVHPYLLRRLDQRQCGSNRNSAEVF